MRRVIIESPFAGRDKDETDYNLAYLRACLHDSLMRGEAPFASHAIYTQPGVLDDKIPAERTHGIEAGFAWREAAVATIVYTDLGISHGMTLGIEAATKLVVKLPLSEFCKEPNHVIEYRELGGKWAEPRETINERTTAYWHGCWLEAGHHLWNRAGRSVYDVLPFSEHSLDSGYAPCMSRRDKIVVGNREDRHAELPQGQFVRSVVDGWTIIAWWDRTQGDTRPGCNSCYIVRGDHTTAQMLKWFPIHFPKQAKRLADAGVKLVEVFATS
jgi:hypothetical protein